MGRVRRFCSLFILFSVLSLALCRFASGDAASLRQGLMAYYSFNNTANLGADDTGNGRNGTLQSGVSATAGRLNGGLNFNGTNTAYVSLNIGPLIASMTDCTVATWVNFSNQGGSWQRIFDFGTGNIVYMFLTPRQGTNGAMRFAITIGGNAAGQEQLVNSPNLLPTGWHYVAVTIGGGAVRLYYDGALVATNAAVTLTPSRLGNTTNNWLGRSQYSADGYYQGMLDEFGIWNRTLGASEIVEIYNSGNGFNPLAPPTQPPMAPSGLYTTVISSNKVSLNWMDNANNEDGFMIERKEGAGNFVQIDQTATNDTSYLDTTVQPSTTYTYRVRAYNVVGVSAYSNEATASTPLPELGVPNWKRYGHK